MPVMVLCGATHFPKSLMPLFIFEDKYRQMLSAALEGSRMFGVACARPEAELQHDDPTRPVFTAGLIRACVTHDDGTSHLMLQGLRRVKITGWVQEEPYRIASIEALDDISIDRDGEQQLAFELLALCQKQIATNDDVQVSMAMRQILEVLEDPVDVADMVAHNFVHVPEQRQELLEMDSLKERLEFLIELVREGVEGI